MNESAIVQRVGVLPKQFASRLDGPTNRALLSMMLAGNYAELMDLLISELIDISAAVTRAEHHELRELFEATRMPIDRVYI